MKVNTREREVAQGFSTLVALEVPQGLVKTLPELGSSRSGWGLIWGFFQIPARDADAAGLGHPSENL